MIKKTNYFFRKILYPQLTWKVETDSKEIYLTFDDGPIPRVTEWVLKTLKEYNAKATFFCVGDNIRKHPDVFKKVLNDGHAIGNHTFNHLKGWTTLNDHYFENISLCQSEMTKYVQPKGKPLFRPPHGQITYPQITQLTDEYEIIMWHVLTMDYESKLDEEKCLDSAIKNTEKGSIVVFHDSLKAEKNLYYVLPRFLQYFKNKGYKFNKMPTNTI
ncbi:polysaccharide deacetylase family protein [Sediminitomix flava]|uniref:Peptidoglycan/xylan/chitin deacetylase (PgdA/CDA1 family) n=1 Tax=Sediminitomix flava TaxID=379075 RepID=A0A315Z7N0_SEDFL|nr:polysaccharide deacetylase family protein [Sediminitomix flava]PWJ38611.1 peptidoglycan/xylan/chitin deacetylase (PgdA/CDA1 family) [Sediminitomix flava]